MKINTVSSILDYADSLVEEELTQESLKEALSLQQKSIAFLKDTEEIRKTIAYYNEVSKKRYLLKQQLQKEEIDSTILEQRLKDYVLVQIARQDFINFISKVFKYQDDLNAFLGQQVKVVYVYNSKDGIPSLYELNDAADAVRVDKGSRGQGIIGRFALSKTYLDNNATLLKGLNRKFDIKGLQKTYKEVVYRGKYGQKVRNSRHILILWKPDQVWKKMFVSSYGDINEAYAAFFLKNELTPSFNSGTYIENLIDDFMLNSTRGVTSVTNLSGMLQGDVSINNIEYAIKSRGASILSYNQIITMAEALSIMPIHQISENLLSGIKKKLQETEVARNILLEENIEDDILKQLKKDIKEKIEISII